MIQLAQRVANDPDAKPTHLRLVAWYATAACRMTKTPPAEYLDTHALTLARIGRFPEAAVEVTKAAEQARVRGDGYLASRLEARAMLFRAGKSYLPEPRTVSP